MNWGTAIKTVFSKYATFAGVASRSEYWYWVLFRTVVSLGLIVLQSIFSPDRYNPSPVGALFSFILMIFALGTLLPSLAVLVRRFHDAGFSGHLLWIALAPALLMLIMGGSYLAAILGGAYGTDGASMLGAGIGALLVSLTLPMMLGFAIGVFYLVLTLLPSKTKEQGNKYAK